MMDGADHSASYPIGKFRYQPGGGATSRASSLRIIRELPARVRDATRGLDDARLDTPYRVGGWTVRQVVHHLADSHLNSYTRFKLALTEANPRIKPYDEKAWAVLPDSGLDIGYSLAILEGLHARWAALMEGLAAEDWEKGFDHPVSGVQTLDRTLHLYAWHSLHHTAHITELRKRMGW